jgi:hypothetical protein
MKKLIAIYGGTDLSEELPAFVEALGFAILTNIPGSVIVTGGFHYKIDDNGQQATGISTDLAASMGAERFAAQHNIELKECLKTWIPEMEKDRTQENVVRFKKGDWEILKGRSAQARRFELVQRVDAVVTVKGKKNTSMVLDFAIITGKPFLPLSFTGGDSEEYWHDNEALIEKTFDITQPDFTEQLKNMNLTHASEEEKQKLIQDIVSTLKTGLKKTCLVLRAYDDEPDKFYQDTIRPAIEEEGFAAIDIKEEINDGNILSIFLKKLETSDIIIADITEANPNVMYEIGHAHARKLPVVLYCRKKIDDSLKERLPFYLTMEKVEHDDTLTEQGIQNIITRIRGHLKGGK